MAVGGQDPAGQTVVRDSEARVWAGPLTDTEVIYGDGGGFTVFSTQLTSPGNTSLFIRPRGLLWWWAGGREAVELKLGGDCETRP